MVTVPSGIEILQAACEALNSTWIGVDRMPLDQKMRAIEARNMTKHMMSCWKKSLYHHYIRIASVAKI